MENASKALIIAGAILLAIIIISLGIMVVNNARSQIGTANLDSTNLQAFNTQWDMYTGNTQTAAQVDALCSAAIASNAAEKRGSGRYVTVVGADAAADAAAGKVVTATALNISETGTATTTTRPVFSSLKTYTVKYDATAGYNDGYVSKIVVTTN